MSRTTNYLTLDSVFPFGKWKGVKLSNILDEYDFSSMSIFGRGDGYSYLLWAKRACKNIELGEDVLSLINRIGKQRAKEYIPQKSYVNWNNWGNYDDRQLMMSEYDYGIY